MSNPAEHNARQDALYRRLEREQADGTLAAKDEALRTESLRRLEQAMQSLPWSYCAKSVEGSDIRRTMDLLGVPLYYVERDQQEEAGP